MKEHLINLGFPTVLLVVLTACNAFSRSPTFTPDSGVQPFIETTPLPTVDLSEEPSSDFAFSLRFGACYSETLNTFEGTFTRDTTGVTGGKRINIPLELSNDQMASIYEKIRSINLFGYPEPFFIPTPANGTVVLVMPAMNYQIAVRNNGLSRILSWTDSIVQPTTVDADNLRDLFKMIVEMVREHPDYKKLPPPEIGCV